jgi:hypothetical protein
MTEGIIIDVFIKLGGREAGIWGWGLYDADEGYHELEVELKHDDPKEAQKAAKRIVEMLTEAGYNVVPEWPLRKIRKNGIRLWRFSARLMPAF